MSQDSSLSFTVRSYCHSAVTLPPLSLIKLPMAASPGVQTEGFQLQGTPLPVMGSLQLHCKSYPWDQKFIIHSLPKRNLVWALARDLGCPFRPSVSFQNVLGPHFKNE